MNPHDKLKGLREKVKREEGKTLPIDKQLIITNLKSVYDPEMSGVSVYELGLIYNIDVNEKEGVVELTHTLTSAFCPASDEIVDDIKRATEKVDGVDHAEVITTFEPLFKLDMMSDEARMILGM